MKWIVSQIGRREEYCSPRSLFAMRVLERFYTDIWIEGNNKIFSFLPGRIGDIQNRFASSLNGAEIVNFNLRLGTYHALRLLRPAPRGNVATRVDNLRYSILYDAYVASHLRRHPASAGVFIGFTSASLETLKTARKQKMFTILDQIDPAVTELMILREEASLWPDWEAESDAGVASPPEYFHRIREEWLAADAVLVNSNFSRRALVEQGVPYSKICVIPLAYETHRKPMARRERSGSLRVLWVGTVMLRKGIQYLRAAARQLEHFNIEFIIAGPINIKSQRLAEFPSNVKFLGKISAKHKFELYEESDIFVLPTVAEGFAITQIEAMAYGLPVITTPNCGDVVDDGVNGYIIPIRDANTLADKISHLANNPSLLREMSESASAKSSLFSIAAYGARLGALVRQRTQPVLDA